MINMPKKIRASDLPERPKAGKYRAWAETLMPGEALEFTSAEIKNSTLRSGLKRLQKAYPEDYTRYFVYSLGDMAYLVNPDHA